MTVWQLIVGLVLALGGVVWAVAKADLEDPDLYRWLTRKLVYRAALRLPRGERARWRAEAMQNVLDLPGRLPPLLWALDTYARSGRWGRERGAPSRWQAPLARVRAAWQRLRSLSGARSRGLSKEQVKQLHPSRSAGPQVNVRIKPGWVLRTVNFDAMVKAAGGSIDNLEFPLRFWATSDGWRDGLPYLSDEEFVDWLARKRQAFGDDIDRQVAVWRQRQA